MKIIKRIKILIFTVMLTLCNSALGYQIGARIVNIHDGLIYFDTSDLLVREFERNHEIMTAISLYCLMKENNDSMSWASNPVNCRYELNSDFIENKLQPYMQKHLDAKDPVFMKYLELIITVRWPDDPLRQIHSEALLGQATFATLIGRCEKLIEKAPDSAGETVFEQNGLFCNSHFRSLQFLHAMAKDTNELAFETYSLMRQWTQFAYEVSVKDELHLSDYCDYWIEKKNTQAPYLEINGERLKYKIIADVFFQNSLLRKKPCNENEHFWMNFNPMLSFFGLDIYAKQAKWSLGTIFNWRCSFRNTICNVYVDGRDQDRGMGKEALTTSNQMTALGSILHMFQDSFSKAHTKRSVKTDIQHTRQPQLILNPITGFRTYKGQSTKLHEESDKLPSIVWEGNNVLDPIIAGAHLMKMHANDSLKQTFDKGKIDDLFVSTMGNLAGNEYSPATIGEHYKK